MDLSKSKFKTSCFVFIVEKSCFKMIVSVLQGIIHLVRTQNFQKKPLSLTPDTGRYVAYQGVRNVSFSENVVYVPNG